MKSQLHNCFNPPHYSNNMQINVFVILFAVATATVSVYSAPVYSVSTSASSYSEPVSTTVYSAPAYSTEKYIAVPESNESNESVETVTVYTTTYAASAAYKEAEYSTAAPAYKEPEYTTASYAAPAAPVYATPAAPVYAAPAAPVIYEAPIEYVAPAYPY